RARLRAGFGWNDDLYVHFLHRAWDWLDDEGVLCAITPDTWLTIRSKERTREEFRKRNLRSIIQVPRTAFGAQVNTCITVAQKQVPSVFGSFEWVDARAAPVSAWDTMEDGGEQDGVSRWTASQSSYKPPGTPFFCPTPENVNLYMR